MIIGEKQKKIVARPWAIINRMFSKLQKTKISLKMASCKKGKEGNLVISRFSLYRKFNNEFRKFKLLSVHFNGTPMPFYHHIIG